MDVDLEGSIEIAEIRFRRDGVANPFPPTVVPGVTIQLSSTTTAHPFGSNGGLSPIFADNVGADVLTVLSGDLVLSSSATGTIPRPFDVVIPLAARFPFDGGSGANLQLDITIPTCVGPALLDAHHEVDDRVARAGSEDASASTASFVDSVGLVTRLVFLVFEDGFESGDTSAWSLTIPAPP